MKKVFIKYTAEVDDYEFERLCRKARIGKRELHAMLRDVACLLYTSDAADD